MVEQQRQRLEQEITNLVDDLDRSYLRSMQKEMHTCAIKCCDDKDLSMQGVQTCIENCSGKLQNANSYLQKELNNFQNRVQRCVMDCNDEVRDKMGTNTNEMDRYGKMFESCAVNCVDKHLGILPSMLKTMKATLRDYAKAKNSDFLES